MGEARSIARLYGALAMGGSPILKDTTVRMGRELLAEGRDRLCGEDRRFGVGFQLQVGNKYGPPADAFGHAGAGGSMHGAWPTEGVGFSYCMNLMQDGESPDPRPARFLRAFWKAIRA